MAHDRLLPLAADALLAAGFLLLIAASVRDFATRIVPNFIPLALAFVAVAFSAVDGRLFWGLLSGIVVFVLAFLCWRMRWIGGADVKMLAAAAMLMPPAATANFVLDTAVAGGLLGLLYLLARRLIPAPRPGIGRSSHQASLFARVLRAERWRIHRGGPLPYACAIALGALFILH